MRPLIGLLLLFLLVPDGRAEVKIGGPTSPDGKVTVVCDFPVSQRTKNVGGVDGQGLCVFSSIGHAARWQHESILEDLQAKMRRERGGGWPQKVDAMLAKYGPGVPYLQYDGGKDATIIIEALKTGRMVSVTWNGAGDPHYRGQRISHMVNCVYHDGATVCLLDNNFIGENDLVWMTAADFLKGWCDRNGGWAVVLCAPPPPPLPTNGVGDLLFSQCWGGRSGPVGPMAAPSIQRPFLPPMPAKRPAAKRPAGTKSVGIKNYGVVSHKVGQRGEAYTVNGVLVTRQRAMQSIGKNDPLPKDANWQRLTVIDTDAVCKQVLADLATDPKLSAWKNKLVVQTYQPGNWAVDPALGYPTRGLMIQAAPDKGGRGKILHRQAAYAGPQNLAQALRRADPNYDPSKDPDLNHPPAPQPAPGPAPPSLPALPSIDLAKVPGWLWAVLGGGGVFFVLSRKKQ